MQSPVERHARPTQKAQTAAAGASAATRDTAAAPLPAWVPDAVRLYLDHTEKGQSFRMLARQEGRHASSVMRAVRRTELRRDDPLVDTALAAFASSSLPQPRLVAQEEPALSAPLQPSNFVANEETIISEGKRILRRLTEPGAVLAFAVEMEKAAVLRTGADGVAQRIAVVDRTLAQAFALKDWIQCRKPGRVASYEITAAGRAALRRMLAQENHPVAGLAEAPAAFGPGARRCEERESRDGEGARRMRYNLAESPVSVLGRRRDKDGTPFLAPELVAAAERLREDFELAQMGPRVTQNWERFLTGGARGAARGSGPAHGPAAARERVTTALADLGPGLGDVALRVCCFLEGIETTEQRLGWAARSGKIVLRIALERLARHYSETYGRSGPLIG